MFQRKRFTDFIVPCTLGPPQQLTKSPKTKQGIAQHDTTPCLNDLPDEFYYLTAAWAAARRAIGTRKGEQET